MITLLHDPLIQGSWRLLHDPYWWFIVSGSLFAIAGLLQWEQIPCGWNPIRTSVIYALEAWLSLVLLYTVWRSSRG